MVDSMHDWMRTDFTGRHQSVMQTVDGSTTLVGEGKPSIVKAVARSKEPFPFGVSGSSDSLLCRSNLFLMEYSP